MPNPSTVSMGIKELQPAGALVTGALVEFCSDPTLPFCASCPDPSETVVYSLLLPVDSNAFYMNSTTNQLQTTTSGAQNIRFESSKTTYFVTISASTSGGTVQQTYSISVIDVNNPPTFTNALPYFYITMLPPDGSSVCQAPTGTCNSDSSPVQATSVGFFCFYLDLQKQRSTTLV